MKHPPTKRSMYSLPEWLAVHLDIPSDLPDGFRLEMRGRHTMTVHGTRRILDFTPTAIRLSLGSCALLVCGERLICTAYLAGAVGIEGCIEWIRFERSDTEL